MIKIVPIPKGKLLTVSSGIYSDYTVHGIFRATKEIDLEVLRAAYLERNPEQAERYMFREEQFLNELTRDGFLEPLESWEMYLGEYSTAEEMGVMTHE